MFLILLLFLGYGLVLLHKHYYTAFLSEINALYCKFLIHFFRMWLQLTYAPIRSQQITNPEISALDALGRGPKLIFPPELDT